MWLRQRANRRWQVVEDRYIVRPEESLPGHQYDAALGILSEGLSILPDGIVLKYQESRDHERSVSFKRVDKIDSELELRKAKVSKYSSSKVDEVESQV